MRLTASLVALTVAFVLTFPGPHTFTFACRKTSSVAVVQFPAERARLGVIGG